MPNRITKRPRRRERRSSSVGERRLASHHKRNRSRDRESGSVSFEYDHHRVFSRKEDAQRGNDRYRQDLRQQPQQQKQQQQQRHAPVADKDAMKKNQQHVGERSTAILQRGSVEMSKSDSLAVTQRAQISPLNQNKSSPSLLAPKGANMRAASAGVAQASPQLPMMGSEAIRKPALATPLFSRTKGESIDERRQLPRLYPPSTLSHDSARTPLQPFSPSGQAGGGGGGSARGESGVLGQGDFVLATITPAQPPLARPLTPVFPPLTPLPAPASSSAFALPLSPTVVPFSFDKYLSWLHTTPAKEVEDAKAAKSSQAALQDHAVDPNHPVSVKTASGRDEKEHATSVLGGGGGGEDKAPGLEVTEHAAFASTAPSLTPPPLSATTTTATSLPPATQGDLQRTATARVSKSPGLTETPLHEIGYDRSFSVSTDWEAVLAAPPLTRTVAPLPSLLAPILQEQGRADGSGGSDGGGAQQEDSLLYSQSTASPLLSQSTGPLDQRGPCRCSADRTVLSASQDQLPSNEEQQLPADLADEGLRAFVKNFQHGKVHTRPPWFLCSTLLTNCEHPHYAKWLDELDLGTVEEELRRASTRQNSVLGDP